MLVLYNKDFTTKYGAINTTIEAFVEEERNGLFELSFIMLNTDSLFNYVKEDNIVVANANDTLLNQKFRIYMTRKLMNNRVEVFARHISFDLMYDYIDSINFENQSCEYALNMLFRNSNFSKHYKGYSDIINAQDYSVSMANILEAIGGKEGSIIDTFGTGAELLRDNENIHVLNKRGYDNSVSIEYKKNLTGFELEEDTTELITRILPYAKYSPQDSEGNSQDEVIIKANYVDSPLIANYSHPFIKAIDYSDKFDDENIPAADKLKALAELEYKNNKVDMPKQNFKIEFIPLSKCVGYEGLSDNISLCDTVTIKDTRCNINTQAKVIKTTYNVLKNRYESMELGEPKTSLGDIMGNNDSAKGEKGDKGDKGDKGEDGSIGDFPNSLPSTPIVTAKVYGFANIEISWTFENKVYYQYEVYASKEADFTPNTFNLIHSGQTSSYLYQAKPNETWYFKVCCINSHGERTDFGASYATTSKVDDLSNYVSEMAIDEALIGTLSLDRGWVGELKGNYIDAKQLSVTNGNGKRTLDIDSYGNIYMYPTQLKVLAENTEIDVGNEIAWHAKQISRIDVKADSIVSTVEQNYYNKAYVDNELAWLGSETSRIEQKANSIISSVATKVGAEEVSSIIRQSSNDVQIGFNGINDRININPQYMQFISQNGNKDLLLYNGQVCVYNNMDNTFMSTMGSILNDDNTLKGVGFIAGANASNFIIHRDANWDDILTNRSPNPTAYLNIDFNNYTTTIPGEIRCNTVNLLGGNIVDITKGGIKSLYSYGFHDYNTEKLMFRSDGWNMINGANWDWQHHNILNPNIIDGVYGYSVINNAKEEASLSSAFETDTLSEIEIVNALTNNNVKTLDVSNVTNKEEIMLNDNNIDLSKLVTLLVSEVKKLKNEINKDLIK